VPLEERRSRLHPRETDEEKKAFAEELKAMKPAERSQAKKDREAERKELARRKALLERPRLHREPLPLSLRARRDDEEGRRGRPRGHQIPMAGTDLPRGQRHELPLEVVEEKQPGVPSKFQIRFNHFFPGTG
jgi:hypothetical protein